MVSLGMGWCIPRPLTDHGPGYYSAESTRNQDRQRVRMGAITAKGRQELLAALVCHEVNASAQRVSHYIDQLGRISIAPDG